MFVDRIAHKLKSLKVQPLIFADAGGVQMGTDGGNDVSSTVKSVREGKAQSLQRMKNSRMVSLERRRENGFGQE